MKRLMLALAVLGSLALGAAARAGYVWEYAEGKTCDFGADLRLRLEHWDRDVLPNWSLAGLERGPALEYLRVRERIWASVCLTDDVDLFVRIANRWHETSSHFLDPNDQFRPHRGAGSGNTWGFPDEVYIDNLYVDVKNIMDSNWSLRLGRQDLMLGLGMVMLEGTPFDQGRSIYVDGAVATYKDECDTVKLIALYNTYRDWMPMINDRHRDLRWGDVFTAGVYWTHNFKTTLKTDLYAFYNETDDDHPFNHGGIDYGSDAWIAGVRVFGDINEQVSYSYEFAQQMGELNDRDGVGPNGAGADLQGRMIDARLNLKAAEGTRFDPQVLLEYTYLSGDAPTADNEEYNGWFPMGSAYPIWREELLPIRYGGWWTNMHQYRGELKLQMHEKVALTGAYALLKTDVTTGTGAGDNIGHLFSGFIDWAVQDNVTVKFEASQFYPGNNDQDGQDCEWLRIETVIRF